MQFLGPSTRLTLIKSHLLEPQFVPYTHRLLRLGVLTERQLVASGRLPGLGARPQSNRGGVKQPHRPSNNPSRQGEGEEGGRARSIDRLCGGLRGRGMERVPLQPPPPPPPPSILQQDGAEGQAGGGGAAACVTTPMTMMLPFGTGAEGGGDVAGGIDLEQLQQDFAAPIPSVGIPPVPTAGAGGAEGMEGVAAAAGAGGVAKQVGEATKTSGANSHSGAASGVGGGKSKKGKGKKEKEKETEQWQPATDELTSEQVCEYNVALLWQRETQAIEGVDPGACTRMRVCSCGRGEGSCALISMKWGTSD